MEGNALGWVPLAAFALGCVSLEGFTLGLINLGLTLVSVSLDRLGLDLLSSRPPGLYSGSSGSLSDESLNTIFLFLGRGVDVMGRLVSSFEGITLRTDASSSHTF